MIYDKASLVHIPSGYNEDILYNVLPNDADGDFTYSGGTNGTRVNKDGLIETIAADTPRLNYSLLNGVVQSNPTLLLEPSRTNLQVRSEEFDNAAWTKSNVTVSANQTTSPNGATTADKIVENSGSGSKKVYDNITTSSGTAYTWSVFLKADTRSKARLNIFGSYAEFDVANQTLLTQSNITSYKIEDYGNGWGRFSITETANNTSTLTYVYLLDDAGNVSYTGDGVSGLFVFGAQLEAGSYPTSYIKNVNTSAGVTRSADVCNGAGTADDFNDSEGVLYAEIAALSDDSTYRFISISDGSSSNRVFIGYRNTSNNFYVLAGTASAFIPHNITNVTKIAVKYKSGDTSVFIDGFEAALKTDTYTLSGLNELAFDSGTGSPFYGTTKEVITFNEALSDTELETLTSYRSFNSMAKELLFTIE